jgi:hypothetical protein
LRLARSCSVLVATPTIFDVCFSDLVLLNVSAAAAQLEVRPSVWTKPYCVHGKGGRRLCCDKCIAAKGYVRIVEKLEGCSSVSKVLMISR